MANIKVLLADDHTIVREGVSALLEISPGIEIAGEASDGNEVLEFARKQPVDLILMDLDMPVMGGLEATRNICKEFPEIKILVLTQYDHKEHVLSILEAGAHGFLNKSAASSELLSAIRAVYRGDSYLSPSATRHLVESYQEELNGKKGGDLYEKLTDREKEVFRLLAEGRTVREIAGILVISPKTVDSHRSRLMSKLDLENRSDLIKYALRKKIIPLG
ncbi:MAG: response regulator transcription factor [Firmicutes bacterium]|nr:response regulator transcription factor [Bacillota bacterium]